MSEPASAIRIEPKTTTIPVNPLAVLKPAKPPRLYTLAEFLRKEEKSLRKHEYHNGKIIVMSYSRLPHNLISGNIITALNIAIEKIGKDYMVATSDQMVYFTDLNIGVYPDALVVCEKPEFYDDGQLLLTNPVLVVEVLSKSTRNYDLKGKFDLYKTLPSFREYVLVEQNKISVETRFRVEPNLWRENRETEIEATLKLESLGISLPIKDIYKKVQDLWAR